MPRSRRLRLFALACSNVLIPVAALVFASGFFPYKPFLPGLATFENEQERGAQTADAVFDRVVFMVVDALRSDFVYGYESGFHFTQSLIRSGAAIPFTAHATPPTVTMPRVKALTTGSVPSFLDLILNFAESDTTSSLANQDTWLAQIRAKGGKLVFYGDDTWLKLFPGDFFARSDGTSSFFVSDFTEVDNNVTRHVPDELKRDDWNALIMHYLGLDHIGHKTGPQGPSMLPKQREMDGVVQQIYEAMEKHQHHKKTLLVLAGDHGMNAGGNHGGSGPGETEPALLFASPKFKAISNRKRYECPATPKAGTEFHYYSKVEQSDVVPALAGLMGLPISMNSLGVSIPELASVWTKQEHLRHLQRNAKQMLNIIHAKYGREAFDRKAGEYASEDHALVQTASDEDGLATEYGKILQSANIKSALSDADRSEQDYYQFLNHAQQAMSDTASSYNVQRMVLGIATAATALVASLVLHDSLWPPSCAGSFFVVISTLYAVMLFASSYVEEEQHFWYWLTPVWILVLTAKKLTANMSTRKRIQFALAGFVLLSTHRLAVRWNQTGQKHAGEPDIVHTIFPQHHILMWTLVLLAYMCNGFQLQLKTFLGIVMNELALFIVVSLTFLSIVFKLNITQADAPELVQDLGLLIRQYSASFSLVEQARIVFVIIAISTGLVAITSIRDWLQRRTQQAGGDIALLERLHHLLTLFLMAQTRAPNIPLFLIFEVQRLCLSQLLDQENAGTPSPSPSTRTTEVATSVMLLSNVYYFCMGGSNSISSIDLSNAYNGVSDYNIAAVGVLLFASNWSGPIWWCNAAALLMLPKRPQTPEDVNGHKKDGRTWVAEERSKLHNDFLASLRRPDSGTETTEHHSIEPWFAYIASMTSFVASSLLGVMAACTALRTHLFIWTVFSPKYLHAMAWALGWHFVINIIFGSTMFWLSRIS